MYKDVLKKFGAKILIVICSVLLLGGVAIAAPRLKAADGDLIDLSTVTDGAIQVGTLRYKDGAQVFPESITIDGITGDGQTPINFYLHRGENAPGDYIVTKISGSADETQATEIDGALVKVKIEGSKHDNARLTGEKVIQYRIEPKILTDINWNTKNVGYIGCKETEIAISAVNTKINPNRFEVRTSKNGDLLDESQYTVHSRDSSNNYVDATPDDYYAQYPVYIKMKNYCYQSGSDYSQYYPVTVSIVRHVRDLNITLNGVPFDQYPAKADAESPTIEVKDGTKTLKEREDYRTEIDKEYDPENTGEKKIRYTVKGVKHPYAGEISCVYSVAKPEIQFVIPGDKVDYDETKNTYILSEMTGWPDRQINMKEDGTTTTLTGNDVIVTPNSAMFVKEYMSSEPVKEKTTAGWVRMELSLRRDSTRKGYLYYRVIRSLVDPNVESGSVAGNNNSRLHFDDPIEKETHTGACGYNGSPHIKSPVMYFDMTPGETGTPYILNSNDYDITYTIKRGTKEVDKDILNPTNAGTVYMNITGKGNYKGQITGRLNHAELGKAVYTIESVEVSKEKGYSIGGLREIYPLGTTKAEILQEAVLFQKNAEIWNVPSNFEGKEYTVKFYAYDENGTKTELKGNIENAVPGKYELELTFIGNYEGTISKDFSIEPYSEDDVTITIADKCHNGECEESDSGANHTYTGSAHEPNVKVTLNGTEVDLPQGPSGFSIEKWENNIDAGIATVYIKLAGNTEAVTREFTIDARSIDQANVKLLEDDGFETKDGTTTHEYWGKNRKPDLSKLEYAYTWECKEGNGSSGTCTIPLNRNEEKPDFELDPDLYFNTNNNSKVTNIELDKDYYYKISLNGNNFTNASGGNNVFVGPFKFTARSIKETELKYKGVMDYDSNADTLEKLKANVEDFLRKKDNFVVTDRFINPTGEDTLIFDKDYEIASATKEDIQNLLKTNGTIQIKLTGKGCYIDKTNWITINVGHNIADTTIRERKTPIGQSTATPEISFDQSDLPTVRFKGTYKTSNDTDPYSINFMETEPTSVSSIPKTTTYLFYGNKDISNILLYKQHYTIDYEHVPRYEVEDGVNVQYYSAIVTGINGYYGSAKIEFKVQQININDCQVEILHEDEYEYIYDGIEDKVPVPVELRITYKGTELSDDDYKVTYPQGNTTVGEKKIIIEGQRGYNGKNEECRYTIKPRRISKEEVGKPTIEADKTAHYTIRGDDDGKFEIELLDYEEGAYPYIPNGGVQPKIKLWYTYERLDGSKRKVELEKGKDYMYIPLNEDRVSNSKMSYGERARIKVYTLENMKFTSEFETLFDIAPVYLDAGMCFVELEQYEYDFAAHTISPAGITVGQYINKEKTEWRPIPESQYTIEVVDNYYVSGTRNGQSIMKNASVIIWAKYDEAKFEQTGTREFIGNYRNSISTEFRIIGNLSDPNPDISYTRIEPNVIPYSTIGDSGVNASGVTVYFNMKRKAEELVGPVNPFVERELEWGKDYNVYVQGNNILGMRAVIGSYPENTYVEGIGNFKGKSYTKVIIQGDLGGAETSYRPKNGSDGDPVEIAISGNSATAKLQDAIVVTCGGKTLTYDEDYVFAKEPEMIPGEINTVIIKPKNGVEYLAGEREIRYAVKQQLDLDGAEITGINDTYIYAHGRNVLDLDKVRVKIPGVNNDVPLRNGQGCEIIFEDNDGYSVSSDHQVIIKPSGNMYNFTPKEVPFKILPYNLAEGQRTGDLRVAYRNNAGFRGEVVYPKITSVEVGIMSGSSIELSSEDTEDRAAAYVVDTTLSKGDNINYTKEGDTKPTFMIRGTGSYIGEIECEYSITRKLISDEDFVFEPLEGFKYQNGQPIKPLPKASYAGKDWYGQERDENADYTNWDLYGSIPYTYKYLASDLTSAGKDKTIFIQGVGNFEGELYLTYNVDPLNLEETELTIVSDTPVYDGKEQKPSFTLTYNGLEILSYSKRTGVVSDYIKNLEPEFSGNIDATKDGEWAKIKLVLDEAANSNYTGTKEGKFKILPASLTDHVKFMYHPKGEMGNVDLKSYQLHLPWVDVNTPVKPKFVENITSDTELEEEQAGIFYDFASKANHGSFLVASQSKDAPTGDYVISYKYVEPDSEDVDVKEGYGNDAISYAGKVKVTIEGINNYADSACFWYFIGEDISKMGSAKLQTNTTVYNAQKQPPVVIVNGIDSSKYSVLKYRGSIENANIIQDKDFVDAATYYIRIEGAPAKGTYTSSPITLTYNITPRQISSSVVIDGFKKEYNYTGYQICPIGISVTDYIDNVKYRLTESIDYSLAYTNNINVGTATMTVKGENNFKGSAIARFAITSSMISGGNGSNSGGSISSGTGQISGAVPVSPDDVRLTLDTVDAMYYTGKQLYPTVSIMGMTENIDYTVTYGNNTNVGTGTITITGIGNNSGTIIKNFRIIARLSDCKITNIPDQKHTGSAVTPTITVTCGNTVLSQGTDYTVSFVNNVEIGTATVMIRAANNSNYVGSTSTTFNIGNNVGGFIISGYGGSYTYTGYPITPSVIVESGTARLQEGTEYTVAYENNVNAGTASIIVTGTGKYAGTQTVNFVIEPKNIQICETTDVEDKVYTGDAYTPNITVTDNGKVLQNGVDYMLTYMNNTNPGMASIMVEGLSSNYTGTKIINFQIGGVAVNGLKVSTIKATSVKLKWSKQGYADGYQVCDSKSRVIKTVKKNSASITGLRAGKNYKFKVRSYILNAQGDKSYGAFSSVVSTTTKLKTPNVEFVSTGKGKARISWSNVSGASGYEIFYKSSKGGKYRKLKKINDPDIRICNVTGIKSGKKCYVRVRAFKKVGSKTLYSTKSTRKTTKVL